MVGPLLQRCPVGGRSATGQHVVSERAEGEDIQPDPVGRRRPDPLRCLERPGQPLVGVGDQLAGQSGGTAAGLAPRWAGGLGRAEQAGDTGLAADAGQAGVRRRARALPVADGRLECAVRLAADPDRVRASKLAIASGPNSQPKYDPEIAREHEELPFFAFGHWLVDVLADLPLTIDPVTTGARRARDVPPGEWIEVYYEIRGEGVRPTGKFLRHLVGPDLQVRSTQLTSPPEFGDPVPRYEVPDWAAAAVRASRRHFEGEFQDARAVVQVENESARDEAVARASRIFSYRRIRLSNLIDEQEAWIKEKEASGSERDRRVLPARRGQLAKNKERLNNLEVEHEVELENIRGRRPTASAAVLAAGMVVGT
jgi:hypothetical protein